MMKMGFAGACRQFLSLEGETLLALSTELKKLTKADRLDLISEFAKIGVEIKHPEQVLEQAVA